MLSLSQIAIGWLAAVAWAVPILVVLELCIPRTRARPRWHAIALAAGLLAINMVIARHLTVMPSSSATARIVLAWALAELLGYWLHRAMHRFPLLWRFHRMHHAPGLLVWHQSWWIHPLDIALFAGSTTIACTLAGAPLTAAAWLLVFRRGWGLLLHANIAWPTSPLDHVLVTPRVHHRHHCEDLRPANFAGTFAILDRMFGTWAR